MPRCRPAPGIGALGFLVAWLATARRFFVHHAGHLATVVLMGNIAIRTQEKLYWDAEKLQFTNSDAANALINPPYREGWAL